MELQSSSFLLTERNFTFIISKLLVICIFLGFFWSKMLFLQFMHKGMHEAALNLTAHPHSPS